MNVVVCESLYSLASAAADSGADLIRRSLARKGKANIVLASGTSQKEMLGCLAAAPNIDWSRVTAFHLDEFIGVHPRHAGSSRAFLQQAFVARLPHGLRHFHEIDPAADPDRECARLSSIVSEHSIDVTFLGIGENARMAANGPPADFTLPNAYRVVMLDEPCRRQQMREGGFETIELVPTMAISMSVAQILRSYSVICTASGENKAQAVREMVENGACQAVPASALQTHPRASLYLDPRSASLLAREGLDIPLPDESAFAISG